MSDRVIVREKAKKYELSTEEERIKEFERLLEEIKIEKPDTMIILSAKKVIGSDPPIFTPMRYGNWIHGEFNIKILAELTKEFENAYAEIIRKGYEINK